MQKGDDGKSQSKGRSVDEPIRKSEVGKQRFQHAGDRRLADPPQAQGGQGNAQLGGGQVGIQVGQDFLRDFPAAVFQLSDPRGTHFDDGKFSGNDKAV